MSERMVPLRTVDAVIRVLSGHGLVRLAPEVLRVIDPTHTAVGVAADLAELLDPVYGISLVAPLLAVWEQDRKLRGMAARRVRRGDSIGLTGREADVLAGVADGKSYGAIGRALNLTENTVKSHSTSLLRKLGAHDRAHAVRIAYDRGLLVSAPRPVSVERLVRDAATVTA